MRSSFAVSATALAAAAGLATASSNVETSGQLCADNSVDVNNNWYCQAVQAITYQDFGSSGTFQRTTNMDSSSGQCSSTSQGYSGSLAPLDNEVSLHFRGPLQLKQLSVYVPGASNNIISKAKRDSHERHHAHAKKHIRAHGHSHGHAHAHAHQEVKRDDHCDPANRPMVTATMNGKVVSWVNDYFGADCATATAAPSAASSASSGNVIGSVVNQVAALVTGAPASAAASAASVASATSSAYTPVGTGDWVQTAYYNSEEGTSQGLTFLNYQGQGLNKQTGQYCTSGTWDAHFGNSLSYATSDGNSCSNTAQTLADTTIEAEELIIMTDKSCDDGSCGYYRPKTQAFHGFDGAQKIFMLEFGMPDNGETGYGQNMPAIWMLNALLPRTLQYGNGQAGCTCWPGCGEFDLFEVLAPGDSRCKSTVHSDISGGDSNYFARPVNGTMKAAVTMMDNTAVIKVLGNSFNFSNSLTNNEVQSLMSDDNLLDEVSNLASSLFNLAQMGTTS